MGIEPTNLLHAMQALYQLSYAPVGCEQPSKGGIRHGSRAGGFSPAPSGGWAKLAPMSKRAW